MNKIEQLLTALVLILVLTVPAAPASQAMPGRTATEADSPAREHTLEAPAADPTPAPGVPALVDEGGTDDAALPQEIAGVPGVTEDWWAAVQEQILGDLYALNAEEVEGEGLIYRGTNPDHGLSLSFAAGGVRLVPAAAGQGGAGEGPSWTFGLRTTGYGYDGEVRAPPALDGSVSDANRLEYHRAGLSEWYVNDERGLEQGFTLESPPAGEGNLLVLELALDTGLAPVLTGGPGQAIEFTQPEGNVVLLRYSDLYAYDAAGTSLAARMALSGCGSGAPPGACTLRLIVDAAGAAYPLTIDPLLTVPDWAAVGENSSDNFGYSVAPAGDVNGDGFADLVIGAWGYDSWGMESNGKAYVYHGSPAGLSDTPAWWQTGEEIANEFGYSVATAGDVNGDGYADLVVGARGYDSSRGKVYVYHGSPAGLGDQAAWSRSGDAGELFGHSVSTAGDLNGDGYDDLVVGAPYGGTDESGAVSVYLGSPAGLIPGWLDWHDNGEAAYDNLGWSVAAAGDLNGDGYADLVVGAPGKDCEGETPINCGGAYVYYGQAGGLTQDGPADWTAIGQNEDDLLGFSVGTAGDVNGDGISDLVVTAAGSWPDPGASWCTGLGEVYVYHGSQAGLTPGDPPAWTASGENATDLFGSAAGTIGDVNGDGYDDLVVGAPGWDCSMENPQAWDCGKAYVFHGSTVGLGAIPTWTVAGENAGDQLGFAAATAGDTNGDGYDDLVVGTPGYDIERGKAYVFHGTSLGLTPSFDWTAGGEEAYDFFGSAVATAGDVDGDGFADLVVGAYGYDGERGKAYLFPGTPAGLATTPDWSAEGEMPGDRFGRSVAAAGDVNGDGYHDLVVGAPWNDGNGTNAGRAYIYHGGPAGLTTGTADWTAGGIHGHDNLGASVAAAGDVNCDGYADLVVGAVGYPQGAGNGQAYLFPGGPEGLAADPAWTASGEQAGDHFAYALGTAGDVNGDRCADLVIGAWGYDGNRGKAYLYHGGSAGLTTGPADWTASGENTGDYLGWAVGTAGDVNGDGYSDLALGAWGHDAAGNSDAGRVDLYPGSSAGITTTGAISLIGKISGEHFGYALGTAGDVDGDGYADLIVGAEGYQYGQGQAYLYRGADGGLSGEPAWTATGVRGGDHFGAAVSTAGDVDGDGYSDLVVGGWGYDDPANANAGRAYVYHGTALGLGGTPWIAIGENAGDWLGVAVAMAGDVNGDGYDDLAVGASGYDGSGCSGKVYVFHGGSTGLTIDPAWTASAPHLDFNLGLSVATAGDVNGDGYADLAVGAVPSPGFEGKLYVYYGSDEGLGANDRPADWAAVGEANADRFGHTTATAGDVNGDGYSDLVVGAYENDDNGVDAGKVYLYHGSADGLSPGDTPDWTAVGELPGDRFGYAVATAGDVNGDGYADIVVGAAYSNDNGTGAGKVYLYHGSAAGLSTAPAWTASGNAGDLFGSSVGSAGDVNGDGYSDLSVLARAYDNGHGRVYVFHGSAHGLDVPFSTFSGGDEGQEDEGAISSVGAAGDVDGDGYADLAVGAGLAYDSFGRVYVYHGSPRGLSPTFNPVAVGEVEDDQFGGVVATAGDVNGDGYADLVASTTRAEEARGKVYVYRGNDGGGRISLARQLRGDSSGLTVQPWGPAYTANSFGVSLHAVDPLGRGRARLQVQACPPGVPFGGAACLDQISDKWIEVSSAGEVDLHLIVSGLPEGELYRWRARALYDSPFYTRGPWRRLMGQALEADVRITRLPADLSLSKTIHPEEPLAKGDPITYTLSFASNGPARGVVITDILSSDSISNVHVISSGVAITNTGHVSCCVWSVQDLEAGQGGVITITGEAQVERFVNTAIITGTSPDPNPANNTATVQTHIPGVLYVDGEADGAANGHSWADAYTDLQDALAAAAPGDQIWIAGGVYRPVASGPHSSSFHLVSGVALYGGFGGTERWLHERDPAAQPTVLSGDINTVNNPDDNAYHVLTAGSSVTETAVLEGLIITGGNADGNGDDGLGGGLFNQGGSPTLVNVALVGNAAGRGGGLYNAGGSPTLVNVALSGNVAEHEGGGLYNIAGSPVLTNTTFSLNTAPSGGGLYSAGDSALTLANAILWGNSTGQVAGDVSNVTISHSDVQGGCPAGATCTAVWNKDPHFVDADGPDELAGTLDDDLRLHSTFRFPSPVIDVGDNSALPADIWDLDGDEDLNEPIPFDLSGRWRRVGFTDVAPTVDMGAYEATIVDVLAEADALFGVGEAFRLDNLQLLSADTMADALKNYSNFNQGEWYYAFCAEYKQIDEEGYCPPEGPASDPIPRDNLRNVLLDAVDLYRVAVGWPTETFTTVGDSVIPAWADGAEGVLSSITEIANVHLVFGNEFLVDATDYRFSTAGIPYADQIITQELEELGEAQQQFELIMDLVFRAFNEWGVGDYCTTDQFEQFGVASSLLVSTLNETAARHYMLRDSQAALTTYVDAYAKQYLHMVALDQMAEGSGEGYLQDGSWEMLNNLSQMRERAQAIHQDLDFFGFAPDYVPLQAYEQLLELTEGPTGDTGLLGTARDLEDQARDAQRTFDANESDMYTELDNLEVELNGQLFELCGETTDDYETCGGGLMAQNLEAMDAASLRVGLARLRAQNVVKQIKYESDRAAEVINVTLAEGRTIAAYQLAVGKLEAVRATATSAFSSEDQLYVGLDVSGEAYVSVSSKDWIPEAGFKASLTASAGYRHEWSFVNSTQITWDPAAEAIAAYGGLQALKQAEAQAQIEGANSAATIRNLLLQEDEALEEIYIAMEEFNQLAAEHNHLAEKHSRLVKKRDQAIDRVASHNSHLLSPAYRIWRDSLTTQSLEAHALAAQFAYLTARAAEYELLTPYPDLGQVFRARTSNDLRLFLDGLKVWVQALDRPGQLNRYPYTLSLARDIWGLTDQALDPEGVLTEPELAQERYESFQELLQAALDGDRLQFYFSTALDQERVEGQYLFSPNIWNNRIAGIGAPLVASQGVSVNIITRQSGDVGSPEVILVHGGQAGGAEAYRNAGGQIVYYDPGTAVPVGYLLPAALDPANTTAVLRPGINGVGAIPNSALLNLSVAAATWTLGIPAESRGNLDYSQIEDIEIVLDTTGRALPGMEAEAQEDAIRLQAGLPLAPVESPLQITTLPPVSTPSSQRLLMSSSAGQIGGSYFGSIMITSPLTLTIQVLDFDLANDGGSLAATVVTGTQSSLYPLGLLLQGDTPDGETFQLVSEAFTTTVLGESVTQVVTQSFTLTGQAEDGGDSLRAGYSGTITCLLPDPILVQGTFVASRPSTMGRERLVLLPATSWVQPGASTAITATVYDENMAVISEPRTITFASDLGSVLPPVAETVDGQAVVTFTAGGAEGQATISASTGELTGTVRIQVSDLAPPQADFAADLLAGTVPLTVTFSDLSLGDPTGWFWDFGDGATSTERHPTHTYVTTGTFAVSLMASNVLDADTLTKPDLIVVTEAMAPEALFSADPTAGFAPLTVTFTDESLHDPTDWLWDFGDGGTSAEQHPEYIYNTPGTFTVTLTVSNTFGTDTLSMPDLIDVSAAQAPEASFSADPTAGFAPLAVTFTDESLHDPTDWLWDFGDGGTSAEQHPEYTYDAPGTFTVTLTVSNTFGTDTLTIPDLIDVSAPLVPEALFSANPTAGFAPLTVTFTDESANDPTEWLWDFGDGGTSEEQHPDYTYYTPGTFTVTLTVSNTFGTDTLSMAGYITVEEEEQQHSIYLPLVLRNAP